MIQTKTNKTLSVLALMFLFAMFENNICSSTTRNSISMTSSASSSFFASASPVVGGTTPLTEEEATSVPTIVNMNVHMNVHMNVAHMKCADDPTIITFNGTRKNGSTKYFDLCKWVRKHQGGGRRKRRCNRKIGDDVVRDLCGCACADITRITKSPLSCPAAGPILKLLDEKSCAIIGLTCHHDDYGDCGQVTSDTTCDCKSNDKSSGVVNDNPTWECKSLQKKVCPETPAPVAPTLPPRSTRNLLR